MIASIRDFYPDVRIVVADNGSQPSQVPDGVRHLRLPVDCGLSAARNALIDALDTELLLLLEEDFEFTDETRIERYLDVLNNDEEIGFVGGSIYQEGRKLEYAVDLRSFRDTLHLEPSRRDVRTTPDGVTYRPCDMCLNFGLIRREMLRDHRWPDELKLGEHAAYFESVRQSARWRVAHCDQVRLLHHRDGRSADYRRNRGRASHMMLEGLRRWGLSRMRTHAQLTAGAKEDETLHKPNVVILGVGHSGTSILAKMLFAAGWERGDADEEFGESVAVRAVNESFLRSGKFLRDQAAISVFRAEPWAVKDPRFVVTLHRWRHWFAQLPRPPLLVWLRRETDAVVRSYVGRGQLTRERAEQVVTHRYGRAAEQYADWPWGKLTLDYERLREAVRLFDPRRASPAKNGSAEAGVSLENAAALLSGGM